MKQTLDEFLAAREALFRNPSDEAARAWWTSEGYAPPIHPTVPLATVHRCRRLPESAFIWRGSVRS